MKARAVRTLAVVAVGFIVSGYPASAQDLSRYRAYALESSLDSVIAASGARVGDVKSLHERPARIQELEWRAPYGSSGSELADPVRNIVFTFYNDALYQVVVSYDRDRTEGLTNNDIIESLSATYGLPVVRSAGTRISRPAAALPDTAVLAQWENAASSLTLVRGAYTPDFQLILTSKPLSTSCPKRDPGGSPVGWDRSATPRVGAAQERSHRRQRRSRQDAHNKQGSIPPIGRAGATCDDPVFVSR